MKKDYNRLLYEKMEKEYEEYVSSVKDMSVDQIIINAYEISTKEDILMMFYDSDRPQKDAKTLYMLKSPLDYLYKKWVNKQESLTEQLYYFIEDSIRTAVREMKERGAR